jgi:hypothetical protein
MILMIPFSSRTCFPQMVQPHFRFMISLIAESISHTAFLSPCVASCRSLIAYNDDVHHRGATFGLSTFGQLLPPWRLVTVALATMTADSPTSSNSSNSRQSVGQRILKGFSIRCVAIM